MSRQSCIGAPVWSWSALRNLCFLGLAAYPGVVAVGASALFDRLIPCSPIVFIPPLQTETVFSATIRAEYFWGATVVLLIMACSWTVVHCWRVILRSQPRDVTRCLLGIALFVSVGFAVWLLSPPLKFYNCISAAIFCQTMAGLEAGYSDTSGFEVVLQVLASAQAFGGTTITFIAIASVSVLMTDPDGQGATWQDLEARAERLRSVLYAGALGLVTVYVQMQAMFAIPEALLSASGDADGNPDLQQMRDLAQGLEIFWGSTLTLLLAAAFVPASVILRQRSTKFAREQNPDALPAEIESWMKGRGLMESWMTQLAKVIAIISPLLSGPLATAGAKLAGLDL